MFKNKWFWSILLLMLFVLFMTYVPFAAVIVFYFGCFCVGWNIDNVSEWIVKKIGDKNE